MNTGFVWFSSKQTLRDCLTALFQMAAISLTLRERVSGLKEAIPHIPYSTVFNAEHNTLHRCLLPFVIQLRSVVSCSQKLYILPDGSSRSGFFLPFKAPAFRDNSLVMLMIERSPKANIAVNHPVWTMQQPSAAAALNHGTEKTALVLDAPCEML